MIGEPLTESVLISTQFAMGDNIQSLEKVCGVTALTKMN